MTDIVYADTVDPVGISTWTNSLQGLAEFKNKGGKLLTYHGTRDPVRRILLLLVEGHTPQSTANLNSCQTIPSGQSKRFYDLVASSLSSSGELRSDAEVSRTLDKSERDLIMIFLDSRTRKER